ncbi:MAG: GAF domain-containing sensor histidine kinase [Chloroflexi bacterium]|nr:MAG: GAF domain-containing sensor histidine kinase [Chloroflexota bacterium]
MFAKLPSLANLNFFSAERPLYLFLLIYRWASLLLAMLLFIFATDVIVPGVSLSILLLISLGSTVLITVLHVPFKLRLFEKPIFLSIDLLLVIVLLTFSGATRSPFTLYALSPLLMGALFHQGRGVLLTVVAFSVLYPLTLFVARWTYPSIVIEPGQLLTQLGLAWLVTLLFGSLFIILSQLRQAHQSLTTAHQNLTRQNAELAATYHQLEVIHELTLFLHAPDSQSVQQQLLKAVTKEFDFERAVVAVVNPAMNRLENWQMHPPFGDQMAQAPPLPLAEEAGPIAQAVLRRQVMRVSADGMLVADDVLTGWLGAGNWFVLPMIWQEQTVGALLLNLPPGGKVEIDDNRWPVLTSLVSQAAVALGTIDRTRRLAVEEERNRIARDIHDTVAQSLFGIVFTLDACIKLLPKQVELVRSELVELRTVADKVRQQVRQSVLDLWPTVLTQEQFKLDIDKYVKQCCPSRIFRVDYTIEGDFDGLSPALRRSLYRVCQEALVNAAKHAGVDIARVYLYVEPTEVFLSVRDKGKGFDPKPVLARERDREHFGLKGIQERIEALGGNCNILSQEGQGTQILVRVPLNGRHRYG